jgi:threonine synthase
MSTKTYVTNLTCWKTGRRHAPGQLRNLSEAGKPLRVNYDLGRLRFDLDRKTADRRETGLWAWRELLPLPLDCAPVTLGEGGTPLLSADRLAVEIGVKRLWIKDESLNPTGSFKARGMATAVNMAKQLGVTELAVPSAGNAGGALAAYAAAVGLPCHVFMPRDVPAANRLECENAGADVTLVDGLITDCGALARQGCDEHGWFDVSTLKEPYRVEGKKTMGLELARQLGWRVPDVILYPTGGGTGLVGMDKAFEELEALGWIGPKRPRFVTVQAEGCCPIVRALEAGADEAEPFPNAHTIAAGLRVPRAIGDFVMLDILRRTRGTGVAVPDATMITEARALMSATGICACPEGGACLAALRTLCARGWITPEDEVVLFNTGTGLKYAEAFSHGSEPRV